MPKFDISWLPKVLPRAVRDETLNIQSQNPLRRDALLRALSTHHGQAYVVDLAKDTNLDFHTTLARVLELTAAGDIKIVERDPHAADHLVALSDR